jgi:hypothetical protein
MKGDAILVDLDRVARDPWIDPEFDIADAFVERAMGADVATVAIGEKIVVEDHQSRPIDVDGLCCQVRAFCASRMSRRGTVPGTRPCSTSRSIGSIAEHSLRRDVLGRMAGWQKSHTAVTVFLRLYPARCVGQVVG